jgi:prepilin-type N-terminal cleavage/methylation domain-containing protein
MSIKKFNSYRIMHPNQSFLGSNNGFTLIEVLVVVAIVGIMSTIIGVSWSRYVSSRRVVTTAEKAYIAVRQAQSEAIRTRQDYQVSFRKSGDNLQYSVHIDSSTPSNWDTIATEGVNFTMTSGYTSAGGVVFDYQGNLSQLGSVRFISEDSTSNRRCIKISTLLGSMRLVDNSDSECSS